MAESDVLAEECGSRAKEGGEEPQKQPNQARHDERIRAENDSEGFSPEDMRTSAGRSTSASDLTPYGILARHRRRVRRPTHLRGVRGEAEQSDRRCRGTKHLPPALRQFPLRPCIFLHFIPPHPESPHGDRHAGHQAAPASARKNRLSRHFRSSRSTPSSDCRCSSRKPRKGRDDHPRATPETAGLRPRKGLPPGRAPDSDPRISRCARAPLSPRPRRAVSDSRPATEAMFAIWSYLVHGSEPVQSSYRLQFHGAIDLYPPDSRQLL